MYNIIRPPYTPCSIYLRGTYTGFKAPSGHSAQGACDGQERYTMKCLGLRIHGLMGLLLDEFHMTFYDEDGDPCRRDTVDGGYPGPLRIPKGLAVWGLGFGDSKVLQT